MHAFSSFALAHSISGHACRVRTQVLDSRDALLGVLESCVKLMEQADASSGSGQRSSCGTRIAYAHAVRLLRARHA